MTSETVLTVRYAETDMMGVVHHSNYAIWFEVARTELFKNLGSSYADIEKQGILLPLTGLQCEFKKPARYGDEVVVKTTIEKLTCVRLEFGYEVCCRGSGQLLATGKTMHAWTDASFKPLNTEKKMPELYKLVSQGAVY